MLLRGRQGSRAAELPGVTRPLRLGSISLLSPQSFVISRFATGVQFLAVVHLLSDEGRGDGWLAVGGQTEGHRVLNDEEM